MTTRGTEPRERARQALGRQDYPRSSLLASQASFACRPHGAVVESQTGFAVIVAWSMK